MTKNFIEVDNQLAKNVYCLPDFNHPDTSLNFINKPQILANEKHFFVKASSKEKLFYKSLCDKQTWDNYISKDTLQIFVIEEKTLKENNWNLIYSNSIYLRRLTYSYADIVKNGCKITIR